MKVILAIVLVFILFSLRKKKKAQAAVIAPEPKTDDMHALLQEHVRFYQRLDPAGQGSFRERVQRFLSSVTITDVDKAGITYLDRLYVASSAIMPIFAFSDWAYNNLDEVLIYAGTFTKDFDTEDEERNVLGMVGEGAMQRMMILSLPALRAGFEQNGAGNTGVHEFVHLLDKADGATDGVPEYMLPHELIKPWVRYMHAAIQQIKTHHSDINPYAATNDAEFLAVISEYFFQKPELLQEHHPELYAILRNMYASKA